MSDYKGHKKKSFGKFELLVVLFILLIIVGATGFDNKKYGGYEGGYDYGYDCGCSWI